MKASPLQRSLFPMRVALDVLALAAGLGLAVLLLFGLGWFENELPQLWNVSKGDMILVGPRPERPPFVEGFEQEMTWYRFRHRMRPGITGWAQSHGLRGNTSIDARVQFDDLYIENRSVWLDLKIVLLTIREVVTGRMPTSRDISASRVTLVADT